MSVDITTACASSTVAADLIDAHSLSAAERFSQMAYDSIEDGILLLDRRRALIWAAERMGIGAFEAQLLIACAVRQWGKDHPVSAGRYWIWWGAAIVGAVTLDTVIILKWFW